MWLLESGGDIFNSKRLWLRPGKKFLFGRTIAEVGGFVIANKTISKKHFTIEVKAIESGDGSHFKQRSTLVLTDLGSKIGTLVDGMQIRGLQHILDGDSHEIIVGHYEHALRITWNPVVLSFSFSVKELKNKPVEGLCQRLEGLDVKVIGDFISGSTTHVVTKKRNTAKGLEALINGCYIVDFSFVDALTSVAEEPAEGSSPLETDFDANWPDALEFLPPRSKEPIQRPNSDYHPDFRRQTIFDGYIFVFYEQTQFDTLLGPITSGRGKALLRQAGPTMTTVEEFVQYVKHVAGEKGLGEFENGNNENSVVIVRFQPSGGSSHHWYSDFVTRVSLQLGHRLVEQNEFLDAILNNDASVLYQTLQIEPSGTTASTETAVPISTHREPRSNIPASTAIGENPKDPSPTPRAPPQKISRTRRTVTSRFRGIDDEVNTLSLPEPTQIQSTLAPGSQSQESGMFVSQKQTMDVDQRLSPESTIQTRSNRKRPPPPPIEEEEEDFLDKLAPAAADLKRRRLEEDIVRERRGDSPPILIVQPQPKVTTRKPQKPKREPVDVLAVARQQREKEEEITRADREALQEAIGEMDINEIRKLAVIEEMPIRRTAAAPRHGSRADLSDRWNEQWNGRKNFKKFMKRGETGVRALNKVMIPLEAVKMKDFGIGVEYWLEGDEERQKKKGKGRVHDSEASGQVGMQSAPPQLARNELEEAGQDSEVEAVEATVPTRRSSAVPRTQSQTTFPDKTNPLHNQAKRPAEPMVKHTPAKKARQATRRADVHSDDSDDGLGFKFRKRR